MLAVRVDFVESAGDDDACAIDRGVAGTATTGIVLGVVGLVFGAALTDILNDL